jgi:hypothetical protein
MRADAIGASSPAQPHNNMQPFLGISFYHFPFWNLPHADRIFIVRGNM